MSHTSLSNEASLLPITSSQVNTFRPIYSRQQPNGKTLEILVDKHGTLMGKISHEGETFDARIKGLPQAVPPNQLDKLKEFLHLHSNIGSFSDDIIVNPKLKGGEEKGAAELAGAAILAIGGVIGTSIGYLIWGNKDKPPQQPIIAHPGATIIVQKDSPGAKAQTGGVQANLVIKIGTVAAFAGFTYFFAKDVNIRKCNKKLFHAAAAGEIDEVSQLLTTKSADVNAVNKKGNTPLHITTIKGHLNIVLSLLNFIKYIDVRNKDGNSALHLAIRDGQADIVKALLAKGANVKLENKNKETPFSLATSSSSEIRTLIEGQNYGAEQKQSQRSPNLRVA